MQCKIPGNETREGFLDVIGSCPLRSTDTSFANEERMEEGRGGEGGGKSKLADGERLLFFESHSFIKGALCHVDIFSRPRAIFAQ